MSPDPIDALDKNIQTVVRRAIAKARFTWQAADYKDGDKRVHAYPLQDGSIGWGIVGRDWNLIASGVLK